MEIFKHMPKELWPNECDHVEYSEVYRATKHANELGVDDFLPWNIEHHNQMKNEMKNGMAQVWAKVKVVRM